MEATHRTRRMPKSSRDVRVFLACLAVLVPLTASGGEVLLEEDFESGLERWSLQPPARFEVLEEPGSTNKVLQLNPQRHEFAHVILEPSRQWRDVRLEGRFLFPTEGDGYLGFIYNYQESPGRTDFGCVYVKSNGSYVRISPHYDGNPSWRLWEEYRFDLEGDRRIRVGAWHDFRLDVRGHAAELYVDDMSTPAASFDQFPHRWGALGLEARPGGGEPAWVDDLRVTRLEPSAEPSAAEPLDAHWEILGPYPAAEERLLDAPELPDEGWRPVAEDSRGMLVTGGVTQYRSGDDSVAYLRRRFDVAEPGEAPSWLAVSSANRLDVWFRGYFRGTVAAERFVWSDYLTSARNPGARLSLLPVVGQNEILIRVDGDRFAGGGLFIDLVRPPESR